MNRALDPDPIDQGPPDPDPFDAVAKVADAVLFEGYLLYPYRASAQKNQVRWQWGVLVPTNWGAESGETSRSRTECLLEPGDHAILRLRLRFLQVQARSLRSVAGEPVDELVIDGVRHFAWDEGLARQVDAELPLDVRRVERTVPVELPGTETTEPITAADGTVAGHLVRRCLPLTGRILLTANPMPGPYDVLHLRMDVCNDAVVGLDVPREEALRSSLVGTHAVLHSCPGAFISMTDPPQWAAPAVSECVNEHTWPVLAGPSDRSDLLLSSPIILDDHPQLAPESTVNLFDGLENDEILTLRTLVLTDEEKREARATDPRAAGIIDAVDAMPPEIFERLHGAIRSMRSTSEEPADPATPSDLPNDPFPVWTTPADDGVPTMATPRDPADAVPLSGRLRPIGGDAPGAVPPERLPWWDPASEAAVDPDTDSVLVAGVPVAKGSSVRLRPRADGDAQDQFLVGMRATVQQVVHDVDGDVHLAVSIDDDPAAELQLAHGRFRYFRPDEVEVLT